MGIAIGRVLSRVAIVLTQTKDLYLHLQLPMNLQAILNPQQPYAMNRTTILCPRLTPIQPQTPNHENHATLSPKSYMKSIQP